MKKVLQLTKVITLTLAAVIMFSGTNILTAHAESSNNIPIFPDYMQKTKDGKIKVMSGNFLDKDDAGRRWSDVGPGYPVCETKQEFQYEFRGEIKTSYSYYFDCYLTDFIKMYDESEWPGFVIKGSDGIPFYYSYHSPDDTNNHYVKYCYDETTGWWLYDKSYKGPYIPGSVLDTKTMTIEELIEETNTKIGNGEEINGTPVDPAPPAGMDRIAEYNPDDGTITYQDGSVTYPDDHTEYPDGRMEYIYPHDKHNDKRIEYPDGRKEYYCGAAGNSKQYTLTRIEYPDGRVEYIYPHDKHDDKRIEYPDGRKEYYCKGELTRIEYPDGRVEYKDADVNTLGAAVTLKTDCIKTKKNNAAQKPLPKSVKVGNKTLKRNKTYAVSYEKYADAWETVDAVTDEGIYRLVITGMNGYDGEYKKTLYVTADKTIKAMSSASVKVNKMEYTGEAITSGVIKTAKIGRRVLEKDTDYTVTYKNNTDSGVGQVTLTAIEGSGLLGTKTVNFTITGNKMSKAKVTGISGMTYNPNETMEQDMSQVKLTYNGTPLTKDTDFTVSYVNNTKAGTAKIVFTGKGLYNGTLTKTFKIAKAQLSDSMLDEASKSIEVNYTGKAVKPNVILKNGDTTLKKDTDYTLTYKNNVKVSTAAAPAQITVKGRGSYTGSFKLDFSIIEKKNDNTGNTDAKNVKIDADEPTGEENVADESTDDETVTDEATEEEPATDEPTGDEAVTDEPTGDEPATDEPTGNEPTASEPTGDEPATDEPTGNEPTASEPTIDKPVTDEPTGDKPAADEPTGDKPIIDEPTDDKPVIDEPTADKPIVDESAADEPTVGEPATDEPTVDEPAMGEPVADEPTVDKPTAGEPQ